MIKEILEKIEETFLLLTKLKYCDKDSPHFIYVVETLSNVYVCNIYIYICNASNLKVPHLW